SGSPPHRPRAVADGGGDWGGGGHPRHSPQHPHPQSPGIRSVKVEQALRLIPNLQALAPLRAGLPSPTPADQGLRWARAGPSRPVAKRAVEAEDLRERLDGVIGGVTAHLQGLYRAVVDAIALQERGDRAGAIAALQRAGALEARVGRFKQAETWYEVALE